MPTSLSTTSTATYVLTKYSRCYSISNPTAQQSQTQPTADEWQHFTNPVIKLILDIKKRANGELDSYRLRIVWILDSGPNAMDIDGATKQDIIFEDLDLLSFSNIPSYEAHVQSSGLPLKAVYRDSSVGIRYLHPRIIPAGTTPIYRRIQINFESPSAAINFIEAVRHVCPCKATPPAVPTRSVTMKPPGGPIEPVQCSTETASLVGRVLAQPPISSLPRSSQTENNPPHPSHPEQHMFTAVEPAATTDATTFVRSPFFRQSFPILETNYGYSAHDPPTTVSFRTSSPCPPVTHTQHQRQRRPQQQQQQQQSHLDAGSMTMPGSHAVHLSIPSLTRRSQPTEIPPSDLSLPSSSFPSSSAPPSSDPPTNVTTAVPLVPAPTASPNIPTAPLSRQTSSGLLTDGRSFTDASLTTAAPTTRTDINRNAAQSQDASSVAAFISSLRQTPALYDLPRSELEYLIAHVIREEGFIKLLETIDAMWRLKGLLDLR